MCCSEKCEAQADEIQSTTHILDAYLSMSILTHLCTTNMQDPANKNAPITP